MSGQQSEGLTLPVVPEVVGEVGDGRLYHHHHRDPDVVGVVSEAFTLIFDIFAVRMWTEGITRSPIPL